MVHCDSLDFLVLVVVGLPLSFDQAKKSSGSGDGPVYDGCRANLGFGRVDGSAHGRGVFGTSRGARDEDDFVVDLFGEVLALFEKFLSDLGAVYVADGFFLSRRETVSEVSAGDSRFSLTIG